MRSRHNAEVASAIARRMAAVSAELAALRPETDDSNSAAPSQTQAEPIGTAAGHNGSQGWSQWWPDGEPPESSPPPRPAGTGRHARRARPERSGGQRRVLLRPVHYVALSLVVSSGLALSAWWVARTQPEPIEPAPQSAPLVAGAPSTQASNPERASQTGAPQSTASSAVIVVHVAGKVRKPGIQALPLGSRVADAIAAAGGPKPGASLASLNLARRLNDGEQVLVGGPGQPAVPPASGVSAPADGAGPVSLNSADQASLEALPGIGPVTAEAIISYREQNGPFTSVEQLLDVKGIGEATLAELSPLVTL